MRRVTLWPHCLYVPCIWFTFTFTALTSCWKQPNCIATNFRVMRMFTWNTWAEEWPGEQAAYTVQRNKKLVIQWSAAGECGLTFYACIWTVKYLGAGPLEFVYVSLRVEDALLRRFCSAAGYGWDYPDSEYRDIPLCFPEFLCGRPLLMLLTHENFRLSPAGKT